MSPQRHILLLISCLLLSAFVYAQTEWSVTLNGRVTEDDKPLPRAILILKKNGVEVDKIYTAKNGKFSLVLDSDNEYELYFTKKGYVSKHIAYNTKNVPEEVVGGLYSEFIFELDLFKYMAELNTSVLDEFPVFKVKYYPGFKNLEYDKKHEAKIKARLNVLERQRKAIITRILKHRKDSIEQARKDSILVLYNTQVAIGDSLSKRKMYEEAQDVYEKALEILPKKSYPKDRIVALEKLIKKSKIVKKLSKEMEARYATLITTADNKFNNEQYASARTLYKHASGIAPDRPYPKAQIDRATEELELARNAVPFNKVSDQKYNLIIARADNEFMGEDYVRARSSYLSASRVKPDEQYPKLRILEIDSIAAASRVTVATGGPGPKQKKPKTKKGSRGKKPAVNTEEQEYENYLLALATKYEEGITEEIEVAGGKKITTIIVVKDGVANEYKKEVFSWATYYKKNNRSIARYVFENETKQ